MQLSQIEQTLRELVETEQVTEQLQRRERRSLIQLLERWSFGDSSRKSERRSDLLIAGMGVALGLVCALFPWYIFFNPEKFGVQALKFGGETAGSYRPVATISHTLGGSQTLADGDLPLDKLDPFATGTLPDAERPSAMANQPFPIPDAPYRMVHVINGRALIEDEAGLWVVQPGALLPDNSRVASIEQRAGKWVMITSAQKVIELVR